MKKIISILASLILVAALLVAPASATTVDSDWKNMTGPGTLKIGTDGTTCVLDEGLTLYKYTKATYNIKDFTCKFKISYNDPEFGFFAMTLNASSTFSGTGSRGLFLLFRTIDANTLKVEGQILHEGFLLTPSYAEFGLDLSKELVMHGKDNGDGTYSITFDGSSVSYTFEIPENYMFTEDLNGEGYLSFGGRCRAKSLADGTVYSMTVSDFNGTALVADPSATTSSPSSSDDNTSVVDSSVSDTSSTDDKSSTDNAVSKNTDNTVDTAEESNTLTVVIVVCVVVLVLAAAAAVVVILVMKKKKAVAEEVAEDASEETTDDTTEE